MIFRVLIALVLTVLSLPLSAASLSVFYPTTVRAKVLQEHISAACKNVDITVFGHQRDFHALVSSTPTDAILAAPSVVQSFTDYRTVMRAHRDGLPEQNYFFVDINGDVSPIPLLGQRVGVVDLLGAKEMPRYISQLFNVPIKVKRVTKLEDLLPLISFAAVDTIFVSQHALTFIQGKTAMSLNVAPSGKALGIASLAILSTRGSGVQQAIRECVGKFDRQLNEKFGVDEWK